MPYIDSGGIRLYFEECGRGYPIIFVHEFESDLHSWEAQIRYFSRGYRCIAYNARGYPPSDVPDDPAIYGWQVAVEDIGIVMRDLSIGRAHIVGSSMGAYAALLFGLRYREKSSAIVAAGAGAGSPASDRERWLKNTSVLARALAARGMDAMAEKMARHFTRIQLKHKDPKGWQEFVNRLKQHSAQGMANTLLQCQAVRPSLHNFRDEFSRMTVPVLLTVGDEDKPCLETGLMLKSTIPAAGIWVCPNTGHAINLEEPAAFNAQIEAFFSAVERGSWGHIDRRKQPVSGYENSTAARLNFDGALP
ncbi:alpha/beta hydrolase [Bradyrhizobium sp. LMTR 3]|uniref:alpha/beta fold hydrolase n=1 Tax=Bradyrhizobium sp. LMTR 3 TaxID=189873 RepID=UPI0008105050|nr:alpha/beta hydrolase [Bradyrhizobium sp. LMTR 3]OCK59922.1 alpha/beta hydrolase [Bradyrhizobium sp. LMTR 3]